VPGPKERDLETTRRSLERWLAGRLGGADSVALSPLRGPSDTGFSSDTLLFDATWRRGDEEQVEHLVARIEPRGFNVFPSYDVAVQFRVMHALGDTEVPVPRMRWLEENAAILGAPFYVMDRVDGRVPSDSPPYATGGWVFELSAAEQARLWWSGLEAMARVHTLDWRALGLSFLAGPEGPETPISRQLRYYEEFFRWGVEDPGRYPLLERSMAWLLEHAPAGEPVALCWGDSRLGNQIFHGLECVAVIDWEMVRIGNPVQDLAWWIALDRCFSESLGVPRISGCAVGVVDRNRGLSLRLLPPARTHEVLGHHGAHRPADEALRRDAARGGLRRREPGLDGARERDARDHRLKECGRVGAAGVLRAGRAGEGAAGRGPTDSTRA
jgi:aminoglycoside phosphotransferase (APT) family kinase protein